MIKQSIYFSCPILRGFYIQYVRCLKGSKWFEIILMDFRAVIQLLYSNQQKSALYRKYLHRLGE